MRCLFSNNAKYRVEMNKIFLSSHKLVVEKRMKDILTFLSQLRENNNRVWFQAHKEEYDRLRPRFVEMVQELIQQISLFDEDIAGLDAKNCMYRIYRDIRFSPDKTPYKSYMSAYIAKGGRKSLRAGYYFHIEPDNCMLSGGVWCPEPKLLKALRQAIYDNYDEWKEIVEDKPFRSLYRDWVESPLKIVPRPFPRDCEAAEWLKRKEYLILNAKPDRFFDQPDWIKQAAHELSLMKPYNDFLNYTVDEVYDLI